MAKRTKKLIDNNQIDEDIRINKYLSDAGVCSRREADKYISDGKVMIDGVTAVMGSKIKAGQIVLVDGKPVKKDESLALIAFNKPRGIVCTTDKREKNNIIDYLQYSKRIYPIGRLDKESEGLILLTNDGNIVNKILRAGNNHDKEYVVTVNKVISSEFLKGMADGVPILDTITRPCEIKALDKYTFQIILTQGLNRQIRRMCEYYDYKVLTLKRTRIMNINLGYMQVGGYRNVTEREIAGLNELISNSVNTPETLWNSMEDASEEGQDKRKRTAQSIASHGQHKTSYKKEGSGKYSQRKDSSWKDKDVRRKTSSWRDKDTLKKDLSLIDTDAPKKDSAWKDRDTRKKDSSWKDKDTQNKEPQRKDTQRKDTQRKDTQRKDTQRKDTQWKDKDIQRKDTQWKDKSTQRKDSSWRDKDTFRRDSQREDNKETTGNDKPRKDSKNRDFDRKDTYKKDTFKKDSLKKGNFRKETEEKDSYKKRSSKPVSESLESGKNTIRYDKSGRELITKNTFHKDDYKRDGYKKEGYKKDRSNSDNSTKEMNQSEFKKKTNIKGNITNKPYAKSDDKKDKVRVGGYSNKTQNKTYKKFERSSSRGRK